MRAVRRAIGWTAAGASLLLGGGLLLNALFPFPSERLNRYPAVRLLADRDGRPFRLVLGAGDLDCRPTYRYDADDWIARAIVAAEDRRFWDHGGLDLLAISRAAVQNLRAGRVVSGASTLSTQVIRLIEPRRRTVATKLVEAFRARQMESRLDKTAILEQYLNRAPFGGNLVGIEAAAWRYFGKAPGDLTLAEAALLAGLPQSPARLRPDRRLARAKKRQAYVLTRMEACGMITTAQRRAAQRQPLRLRSEPHPFKHPHFAEYALGRHAVADRPDGLVRTTLDARLQRLAEDALARRLAELPNGRALSAAAVILDVREAAVRAMVGAPDYFNAARAGQVNAAAAPRSAGSALKPFLFARAIERGDLAPATILADAPRVFPGYRPENFDGGFMGLVSARDALALSLNLPALALIEQTGVADFQRTLESLGFTTLRRPAAEYGLGLALGNAEVKLIELANAYAALARGGEYRPLRLLEGQPPPAATRVFSEETAWMVLDMLAGDERAEAVTGHRALVRLPPAAWKTGTSSGFRDAWTIACNPDYVIGVWMGRTDGRPSPDLVGAQAAAPAAWDVVRALYPTGDGPWFARPAGLRKREVCAVSGYPAGPHCHATALDWHAPELTRHQPCPVHRRADGQATWPAHVAAFLRQQNIAAPRATADVHPTILAPASAIVRPAPLRAGEPAGLPLVARAAEFGAQLYWFADGRFLGEARSQEVFWWAAPPGDHRLVCSDARGRSAQLALRVE